MQLRSYQEEAVQSVFDYFDYSRGNPIVAMPTGTGKSLVIAELLRRIFQSYPRQRVMMLTHVKELIEQDTEELIKLWPTAPVGIYSAGLKQRDVMLPIVFGGVASVKNQVELFGHRDLLFIDECHLLSDADDTMYQKIIRQLCVINPLLKVIGLSATPFRLRQGMLTDGGLFTDVCFDITHFEAFNRLIAEGYMAPLTTKPTATKIDLSQVHIQGGEYNKGEMEAAVDKDEITYSGVKEMCEYGHNRGTWMVFAAGIANAEHIASMLQSFGIQAAAVHSKLTNDENRQRRNDFKSGYLRAIVNNNVLTTGFNHPPIDLIGMFRPTISPGLWVQMMGRGTRTSPATGKLDCLALDFAGNTRRLGPINDPRIPGKPGKGTGDIPIKTCEFCGAYNHISARICSNPLCKCEFQIANKLFLTASDQPILRTDAPVVEVFDVKKVIYNLHEKRNAEGSLMSAPSIKVSYFCGFQMFNEWICLEHSGIAGKKARDWWRQRHGTEPPPTTYEALLQTKDLRWPARIRVHMNARYPDILGYEY